MPRAFFSESFLDNDDKDKWIVKKRERQTRHRERKREGVTDRQRRNQRHSGRKL